jgi:hypothetical protein
MHRSRKRRYSITSSASASSVERNVDAERLGGFHLMAISSLVGCTTGRSAAFSPLRIRAA